RAARAGRRGARRTVAASSGRHGVSKGQDQDRRRHATRMFAWEDQVARDPEAVRQAAALRVVAVIRREVGRRAADVAIVDQAWLADQIHVSVRGLQKAIKWLERAGHLFVDSRKRLGLPNVYRPRVRTGVHTQHEPQFAPGTNGSSRMVRTPVRTNTVSSSKISGRATVPADRGTYEAQLALRLGENGWDLLGAMSDAELTAL